MPELGVCLLLNADNLPSAVYLSSVQTPQPSSENLSLMRYMANFLGHLVSNLCECKSPQLEESDWQARLGRVCVARCG